MTDHPASPPPIPVQRPSSNDGLASVVVIDKRDDVAAVCGRVDTAPTLAVVIHAPGGNRNLQTQLGMRRLVRHAEDSGRVIAIATGKRGLAARARATGVPVGRRPDRIRWDSGGRRVVWLGPWGMAIPGLGRYVQFAVLTLAVVLAAAAVLTVLPSADVVASPPLRQERATVLLTASADFDEADVEGLAFPARAYTVVRTVTLAGPVAGVGPVPVGNAKALVTMTNTSDDDITVPYGAVILSSAGGLVFYIDQETEVPAGGSAVQQASAAIPGPPGNVPAGSLNRWEREDYDAIEVTNAEAAAGGVLEDRQAVSEADVAALAAQAETLLASPFWSTAAVEDLPGYGVIARSATVEVGETRPIPDIGQAASVLLLEVEIRITVLAIPPASLEALAASIFRDAEGLLVGGTVEALETGRTQRDDEGLYVGEFMLQAGFSTVSAAQIKDAVKGKSPEDARSTLQERYGIQDAAVDLSPGFFPWLPRFNSRIDVVLEQPDRDIDIVEATTTPDAEPTASVSDTPAPSATPGPTQTPGP